MMYEMEVLHSESREYVIERNTYWSLLESHAALFLALPLSYQRFGGETAAFHKPRIRKSIL